MINEQALAAKRAVRGWLKGPLARAAVSAFPLSLLARAAKYAIRSNNGVVLFYNEPGRAEVFALINRIRDESEMLLLDNEAYQIYMAAARTAKAGGDVAEVGAYRGASAALMAEAKGTRTLHVFDTFEGLPELGGKDDPRQFSKGQCAARFEEVVQYLGRYPGVFVYKGRFPQTAGPVVGKKFSFVHLDVDIYQSTLDCLEFFYPRMERGGIIISHDYLNSRGVRQAFDEFFEGKPEPVVELAGSQCMVVKA